MARSRRSAFRAAVTCNQFTQALSEFCQRAARIGIGGRRREQCLDGAGECGVRTGGHVVQEFDDGEEDERPAKIGMREHYVVGSDDQIVVEQQIEVYGSRVEFVGRAGSAEAIFHARQEGRLELLRLEQRFDLPDSIEEIGLVRSADCAGSEERRALCHADVGLEQSEGRGDIVPRVYIGANADERDVASLRVTRLVPVCCGQSAPPLFLRTAGLPVSLLRRERVERGGVRGRYRRWPEPAPRSA